MAQFPPKGPTTLVATIPSYLYKQYSDDEDLQAFVDAYNDMSQQYVDWFVNTPLAVYTNDQISGALLDWVALGLYGLVRPTLPSGNNQNLGALNTIEMNTYPLNVEIILGPQNYYLTTDDVFKRILTWHLYKGDGKYFNVRFLKRRIMRFLTGIDGLGGETDTTYSVSVTFGVNDQVNINLQSTRRTANGGAILDAGMLNDFMLNEFETTAISIPISPLVQIFKAAVQSGALDLPFQYTWVVNIN